MKHALLPAALLIAAGVLCTNCKTKMKISTLPYPVARMDSTVDDYFGTKVPDPYRWLEDDNSAETAAWVTAENEITQNYLSQIPFRDKIRNRLTELWNYPKYGVPSKHGDYFFFFENDGLQNQSVLYRQKSLDGPAEVFLDPNKLSDDGTVALSDVSFSKDGKYCAYAAASSGSDWVEIRVMDVATRELLPDVIRWVKFSGAVWTRDGFYYSGYDEPKQSEALVAQNRFQKIFFHKLGTEQSADRLIYEDRAHPLRYVSAEVSKDDRHLFVFATEGTSGNEVLWADLSKGAPEFEVLFPGFANDYALVHARDGRAVFYTNEGAPRYRLVQADLNGAEPVLSELLPESELLLEGASVAGGSLFALYLDKAQSAVSQYDLSGKKLRDLKLPGIGAAAGFADNDQEPFTFYSFSEFTRPASIYRYDIATGESSVFKTPDLKFDPDRFTAEQVFFDSKDGTPVSMFLVHRKDMKLDGNNPTYLYGYGGFNISLTPGFTPLSVLLMAGIRDIMLITAPADCESYRRLLGDGSQFGIHVEYGVQPVARGIADAFLIAEEFIGGAPCCLVLGDNMFHGAQLEQLLRAAAVRTEGATVFGYPVKNPSAYGVVEFDAQGQVLSIEEKPEKPKSRYAVPGLYFYDGDAAKLAHTLQPSARGELEITALNELYLRQGRLHVELMTRGMAWLDTGTPEGMLNAAQYVEAVQSRQGLYIACPEEIAWEQGFISDEEVAARGQELRMTEYGQYLLSLVK